MAEKDVTPPPALTTFSGSTSSTDGYVNLTITFPADKSDYDQVVIRRLAGATAPNAACSNGTVVTTFTRPTFPNQAPYADSLSAGQYYSYRACLYDLAGNLTSLQTIVNVRAGWPCSGTRYAENCWYYGNANQSCDTVCSTHGGAVAASCGYAYASNANCGAVLGALGIGGGAAAETFNGFVNGNPLGCWQSALTPGANGYLHPDGCQTARHRLARGGPAHARNDDRAKMNAISRVAITIRDAEVVHDVLRVKNR